MARWLRRRPVRALDVVGVPVLPPPRLTRITTRSRAAVAWLHRSTAPPPVRILESLFGFLDHTALVAVCALDIPDELQEAMTISALAARIGADADAVDRLVRYAVSRGWLRLDRHGRVCPTRTSRFLRRDHPGGWRGWVDFMGGPDVMAASASLADAVRSGGDAFTMANGSSFFDWMAQRPLRAVAFDTAMAAGGRMHGLALAAAIDWSQARRVCDVGGGAGALLEALVGTQAHLSGVLIDLPHVVARVAPNVRRLIDVVPGDAFEAVPRDADSYLLVNVLHDWSDHDATRLLTRIADEAAPTARVIVVEGVRHERPVDDIAQRTDLLMLLLAPGGRERSPAEIASLADTAGLVLTSAVALASGDTAYVLVPAPGPEG